MRRQRGFSLIELLIVIAIILALAAMAIPNLLRSKMSANEASAVASLHNIANAQTTYQITYPTWVMPTNSPSWRTRRRAAPSTPTMPASSIGCWAAPRNPA